MEPQEFIEKYEQQLRELSLKEVLGTAAEKTLAAKQYEDLLASLESDEERKLMESLRRNIIATPLASMYAEPGTEEHDRYKSVLRAKVGTDGFLAAIKAGTGIAQILNADKQLRDLGAPKLPERLEKNEQLSTFLSQQLSRAEQGDPELEKNVREQLARTRSNTSQRARSSGSIGQYAANVQGAALGERQGTQQLFGQISNAKRQDRGLAGQLLGQSVREDARINADRFRRYREEQRAYETSLNNLQAQKNSGFTNLFTGLNEAADATPYLGIFGGQREPGIDNTTNPITEPTQEDVQNVINGMFGYIPEAEQPLPPPPQMNNAQFFMLADPKNRDQRTTGAFQDFAASQGLNITDELGQWGDSTEQAYNELYEFSPMGYLENINPLYREY